jgi:DNA (cytosine-5)-methyltransferase 1
MKPFRHDGELDLMDWFCGAGGSSQGADAVPGVAVRRVANHWDAAIETHALNFPHTAHWKGDIRKAPVQRWDKTQLFWASPECPKWSRARGRKRDFHNTNQDELDLPGIEKQRRPEDERSRALMEEVPVYLRGVQDRGGLVLAGVVENVIDCREWDQWDRWLGELHKLGYRTRVIAINSMHAEPRTLLRAPQSRDRLYVAYWHRSIGRSPEWDKWLRPSAYCPNCDAVVQAMQVFKKPGRDMGRYGIRHGQYVYRCPRRQCRSHIVEPEVLPALAAIDWRIPGTPIGDRSAGLKPKTIARIQAGLAKYARPVTLEVGAKSSATRTLRVEPMLVPCGGTWRDSVSPLSAPMPTRTTRETDALAVPPLLIPAEGRDGKHASSTLSPMRTQTTRNETGLAWREEEAAVSPRDVPHVPEDQQDASCKQPENALPGDWPTVMVPYYGNGTARPASDPIGAFTTKDRWAPVQGLDGIDINSVLYRMLEPHEIGRGMAFADGYLLSPKSKRDRVRLYGNAVTPPVAEVIMCALVECITGTELTRFASAQRSLTTAA